MIAERRSEKFNCQLLFIAGGLLFSIYTYGQDLCSQNLEQAQRQFDEGKFYSIESLLSGCLKSGFTKQERINALELLALTKLYLDEMEEADSVYLNLLREDPEHQVNELIDPPDLIFLHNNFRTKPVFFWAVNAGINFTNTSIIHDYTAFSKNRTNEQYKARLGFELGLSIEFNVYEDLYVGGAFLYCLKNFLYTDEVQFESIERSQPYQISYIDANNFISIPVFAKYMIGEKRIRPYVYAGLSTSLLMFSNQNDFGKVSPINEDPIELSSLDITSLRRKVMLSGIIGIGAMIKSGGLTLMALDLKIEPGFTNITDESQRYSNQSIVISNGIVNDALRINSISLSVRFIRPFYNPKLKKIK
jgi:hypothetical protein